MKRIYLLLLSFCLCLTFTVSAWAAPQWPSDIDIEADGGILMDADTGTILYSKNIDQSYYPASITKILTTLIVLENCSLDEMVEFSYDDVYNVEAGSSSAGIDEGDKLSVRDCLYALMLASANESANALACHVSGSREAFAELMNEKAASLGCTGSHFANPSGLNDENHYTTAHDMALITREAIKNPTFLEISGTRSYKLPPTKRSPEGGYVANHHKMLNKYESIYYPGAFSGKTGYTSLAGNTLVTCATKNGLTLISVILNGHLSHYSDTKTLLDFGFGNFQSLKAEDYENTYRSLENDMTIGGMTASDGISLELDPNGRIIIPKGADFSDLESSLSYELDDSDPSDAIACIQYTYNSLPVGCVYLKSSGRGSRTAYTEAASDQAEASPATAAPAEAPSAPDSFPSSGGSSDGSSRQAEHLSRNIIAGEGTASSIRIPSGIRPIAGILLSLAVIIGLIIAVRHRIQKKEKDDLTHRRQRRLERLEDIGFSASEFDNLVAGRRRSFSGSLGQKRKRRRNKKGPFH
ncbi:MAG: D-alanyl-D-alanine carboxypeptidase family protein [Enterocloster sp.]